MSEININNMSQEFQELYQQDAFFHYCVKGGLDTEGIILGMAKRNKELTDEILELKLKCTCGIKHIFIDFCPG